MLHVHHQLVSTSWLYQVPDDCFGTRAVHELGFLVFATPSLDIDDVHLVVSFADVGSPDRGEKLLLEREIALHLLCRLVKGISKKAAFPGRHCDIWSVRPCMVGESQTAMTGEC